MSRKEKNQEEPSRGELIAKAMQARLQELKEQGKPLHTDTKIYILKDVPGLFGED